ncbi:hypothetical protein ELI81_29780 [Klebsiella pneumoniae]|nr:hypothetical protein [Klebsiella pneumoniae]MBL2265385.1 hypothetical protein [Klebsiella pneumoniae]
MAAMTAMIIAAAAVPVAVIIGFGFGILILSCCGIRDHDEGHSNQNSHEQKDSLVSHCKLDLTLLVLFCEEEEEG